MYNDYMNNEYQKKTETQENNHIHELPLLSEEDGARIDRELDHLIHSRKSAGQKKSKKPLVIAGIAIAVIALVSASNIGVFEDMDYDDYSSGWKTVEGDYTLPLSDGMSFTLEQTAYSLPLPLETLLNAGWEVDHNEYSSLPDQITRDDWVTIDLRKGPLDLYSVHLEVPAGRETCRGSEAVVTEFSVTQDEDIDFTDFFGLSTFSEEDDLEDALDDNDVTYEVYESDDYSSYSVYMDAGDETGSIYYDIYDDRIESIRLSYYSYD